MEITTDATLKGVIWADTIDRLKGTIFDTQWGIFALCISIGIMYDQQTEFDSSDQEPRYVPRNVLHHAENVALLDFMFQAAILTTKHIDMDEDQRLELAFGDEKDSDFNRIAFLTKFANYGAERIYEQLSESDDDIETMESLMSFVNAAYELGSDLLLNDDEIEDYNS